MSPVGVERGAISFSDRADHLVQSLFADRVLGAIYRIEDLGERGPKERKALEDAEIFFKRVCQGVNIKDPLVASQEENKAVQLFLQVTELVPHLGTKNDFVEYIESLRQTVTGILSGGRPEAVGIASLEKFLNGYSAQQFRKSEF